MIRSITWTNTGWISSTNFTPFQNYNRWVAYTGLVDGHQRASVGGNDIALCT